MATNMPGAPDTFVNPSGTDILGVGSGHAAKHDLVQDALAAVSRIVVGPTHRNVIGHYGADPLGVADASTAFNNAYNDGGIIHAPPGLYKLTHVTPKSNCTFRGSGTQKTVLLPAAATGDVFDMTATVADTKWEDFTIYPTVQKTAGSFWNMTGAGFHHLFKNIKAYSPYQGWTIAGSCSDVNMSNIIAGDINVGWGQNYLVSLAGTATHITMRDMLATNYGVASLGKAMVWMSGAPSTVVCDNVGMTMEGRTSFLIDQVSWLDMLNCEPEAGLTGDAVVINGGVGITMRGGHLLGKRGLVTNGGSGIYLGGGLQVVACQRQGILLQGGDHITMDGLQFSDCGLETNNAYAAVGVAGAIDTWKLINCDFGRQFGTRPGIANNVAYYLSVAAVATNNYAYHGNTGPVSGRATAAVSDLATGSPNRTITPNLWL